jgi:transcription elongation factor Elf1
MSDVKKFKPCPFCGSADIKIINRDEDQEVGYPYNFAECQDCGCRTEACLFETISTILWNMRKK